MPRDKCPLGSLPTPRTPDLAGSLECIEETDSNPSYDALPQSLIVQGACNFLNKGTLEQCSLTGFQTATLDVRKLTKSASYRVHSAYFPSTAPTLDADASICDLKEGSGVTMSVDTLQKWETRVRAIVNTVSYMELFNAANYKLEPTSDATLCRRTPCSGRRP